MYQPLADLLRPTTLDEVYGQEHILGKNAELAHELDRAHARQQAPRLVDPAKAREQPIKQLHGRKLVSGVDMR